MGFFNGKAAGGDTLVLVGDKKDLGAFRLSDPIRSYSLAVTDFRGVEKQAIDTMSSTKNNKGSVTSSPAHYSQTSRGVSVWGQEKVYQDTKVHNEQIVLRVSYK
mmetsp:Transcript_15/g.20  ORF Transcript_15/g.20 Transcript_15/m.20 type:complete len:104 (-) Transcript_15:43-354(-)